MSLQVQQLQVQQLQVQQALRLRLEVQPVRQQRQGATSRRLQRNNPYLYGLFQRRFREGVPWFGVARGTRGKGRRG